MRDKGEFVNIIKKVKKYGKYVVGIIASAAIVSQLLMPALGMKADAPRFNFLKDDYQLLQGFNVTKGEDVWKNPVSGDAGDTFAGSIYYHNGMPGTTAKNTRIKINVPKQTTNKSAEVTASLSADNAETVTATVVDGKITGLPGLFVNLNEDADVSFVPGSVKWFPENSKTPVQLPMDQTGNEITSANGVNIGDLQGCFQFAGFITFRFTTKEKVKPANLMIEKNVRNISRNQTAFTDSTNAGQNEKVEFKVDISNNGTGVASNVIASDKLPTELTEVAASTRLSKSGVISSISEAQYFDGGVSIGDLAPGEHAVITFQEQTPANIAETHTVINTAYAKSGNMSVSDTAKVTLEAGVANIVKSKSAYNKTQNVDATQRAAGPGDTIEYTLVTKNTGNAPTEFVVSDGIADVLEYSSIVNISDSGSIIAGQAGTNEVQTVAWPKVTIAAGSQVVNKFTVKVKDPLPTNPANGFHFDDKMFNVYGNEVTVLIARPTPPVKMSELKIDKFVRDVNKNELDFVKLNTAFAGDTLEYKITFENVGDAPADNVRISDVLPANVTLDPSSPAIFSLNGQERSMTENLVDGFTITSIMPGDKDYIRFRVITATGLADGERLKNTAFLNDHGKVISAQAETIVKLKVVPVVAKIATLPKTGAPLGVGISLFASLFTTANVMLLKQKKALMAAARKINLS